MEKYFKKREKYYYISNEHSKECNKLDRNEITKDIDSDKEIGNYKNFGEDLHPIINCN